MKKLAQSLQGFREINDKDGKRIRIPHIGFSLKLDYLDEFINRLAKKIASLQKRKINSNKEKKMALTKSWKKAD